jgi:Uma2 family endonuclease
MASSSSSSVMVKQYRGRLTVGEYLDLPETVSPMELVHGIVRDAPSPDFPHQSVVTRLGALLYGHVRQFGLGRVCLAPMDVVLDAKKALVVQPDIVFVSVARLQIIRGRIWGAPELVVEVLSPRTALRDRTTKLEWYRQYGVLESWLVDVDRRCVDVVDLTQPNRMTRFTGSASIQSAVLVQWSDSADIIFDV